MYFIYEVDNFKNLQLFLKYLFGSNVKGLFKHFHQTQIRKGKK